LRGGALAGGTTEPTHIEGYCCRAAHNAHPVAPRTMRSEVQLLRRSYPKYTVSIYTALGNVFRLSNVSADLVRRGNGVHTHTAHPPVCGIRHATQSEACNLPVATWLWRRSAARARTRSVATPEARARGAVARKAGAARPARRAAPSAGAAPSCPCRASA
jgi:hypothetical protein